MCVLRCVVMSSAAAPVDDWLAAVSDLSLDACEQTLAQLHGMEFLIRSQSLDVVSQLLSCSTQTERSVADWLSLQFGLSRHESRERVRVAVALQSLPCLREAFASGSVDWARLSLVTQLADASSDAEFARDVMDYSLSQLRAMVTRKKAVDDDAINKAHDQRSVRFHHDDKKQKTRFNGWLPLDRGIEMEKACNARADSYGKDEVTGEYLDPDAARADALCELVLGEAVSRVEILVDADLAAFTGDGSADLEGHAISPATLQRLGCEASIRNGFLNEEGKPVGVGRAARFCPPWLSRLVRRRDRGCRFPGCESIRWLHEHHMAEWDDDDGPTDLENVIQICGRHHRYLHEGGWKVRGSPDGELQFVNAKTGKTLTGRAPLLDNDVKETLQKTLFETVTEIDAHWREVKEVRDIEFEAARHDDVIWNAENELDHKLSTAPLPVEVEPPSWRDDRDPDDPSNKWWGEAS
jgi:hypothetical protein